MADEKKPTDSSPDDDLDEDSADETTEASTGAAAAKKPAPAKSEPEDEDEDDEDEDDEDDEDEDEDEDEDDEDEDDEDEDDEDEDDEDEDDEDEDDEDARATSSERRTSTSPSQDWLPDWAPWATLGTLLVLGLLGGLGLLPVGGGLEKAPAAEASATPAATTTASAAATASARRRSPSPMASADQGPSISASHVLVSYQGAMRANPSITRTKEEAKKRAQEVAKKAKSGADFKKLAGEYSDEPRAAERGGDLGSFTKNRMVKPFADAAFELKVNEISDVVETPFGFHVIKRTK